MKTKRFPIRDHRMRRIEAFQYMMEMLELRGHFDEGPGIQGVFIAGAERATHELRRAEAAKDANWYRDELINLAATAIEALATYHTHSCNFDEPSWKLPKAIRP